MQIAAEANRKFLRTAEPQAAAEWDELLRYQVDYSFPQELEFLFTLAAWRDGSKILDVGCGNGYFLSRLQQFFPNKEYFGVDVSPELAARAAARYPAISITAGDLITYKPACSFDVILMRFFVQHLKDFGAILQAANWLLRPRGHLIIIESDLAESRNYPELPIFTDMLLTYARVSAAHGSVKERLLADAGQLVAAAAANWSIEREEKLTCPRLGPFSKSQLFAIYHLWVDLCDHSGMFRFDFGSVRTELDTWATRGASFSSMALRVMVLARLK